MGADEARVRRWRDWLWIKRLGDVTLGLLLIILTLPVTLVAALAVKASSRGPVFFVQERIGLNGKPFRILKFRTMVADALNKGRGLAIAKNDPRLTGAGKLMRRWGIDELPQLFNVVRGEMSLIGPRPTIRSQVERYTPRQRQRLEMRPGITGWAQVNGRNRLPWEDRIDLDVWYVGHWSPWLDVAIALKTFAAVVGSGEQEMFGADGVTPDLKAPPR